MILKCKMCGGDLEFLKDGQLAICLYCGTKQTLPKMDDEKKLNLYERANHFRRNNEYDKAMGIYEMILSEDRTDAEAYWSLILCKYGVEYVEEPKTRKRMITCNRTLHHTVISDEDYKATIRYADASARFIYEEEAKKIDNIQKKALEILLKEEAYDIFISYKETDSQGKRTQDSVLAQEIYQQLTREGYKVFFSRISLEDKVGMAYEPYIFAALNSAKVMLLVGTSKENLNSVWVRNEWSRFMSMQKEKSEKQLFPVYRDMNPYDLPDELLNLQAQDMSRIGAMQDLLHGLEKALKGSKHSERTNVQIQTSENANIENLLRRIEVFLQEGNIAKAQEYCEKILDIKIDEARVYIAQLRMVLGNKYGNTVLKNEEEIFQVDENISKNPYFRKAMNYAQGNYLEKLHELEKKNDKYCYVKTVNHVLNSKVFDYGTCNGLIVQFIGVQNDEKWKNLQACVNTRQRKEVVENRFRDLQYAYRDAKFCEEDSVRKIAQSKQKIEEYVQMSSGGIKQKLISVLLIILFGAGVEGGWVIIAIYENPIVIVISMVCMFFTIFWSCMIWGTKTNYKSDISNEKKSIETAEKNITRQKEIALYKEREIERCQAELNEIEVDMARRKGELEVKTYEGMGTDLL